MDLGHYNVFIFYESKTKIFVGMDDDEIVSILSFDTRCSISAASLVQWWPPTMVRFFCDFFLRSGLSECWIRSRAQGH